MSLEQQQQHSDRAAIVRTRKVPSQRRRDGLIRYAYDRTSQNGEDGIIERIFELIPHTPQRNHRCDDFTGDHHTRLCVDVGAWDGTHLSNTRSLLCSNSSNSQRWRGILIEADPQKFAQLAVLYNDTNNIVINKNISVLDTNNNTNNLHRILEHQVASGYVAGVPVDTDPSTGVPSLNIDFLCIDIDGPDYYVLSDLFNLSQYRPIVICIEFNPTMPNNLIYIPPRCDSQRHVSKI
jgi:hypothetical protein